jgi:hypothetical protein
MCPYYALKVYVIAQALQCDVKDLLPTMEQLSSSNKDPYHVSKSHTATLVFVSFAALYLHTKPLSKVCAGEQGVMQL